jgi:hypothetical protein
MVEIRRTVIQTGLGKMRPYPLKITKARRIGVWLKRKSTCLTSARP